MNNDVLDYKKPTVKFIGKDGNAFAIMGRVLKALRKAGADQKVIDQFMTEAKSSDYDNLLRTCLKYVNEGEEDEDENE